MSAGRLAQRVRVSVEEPPVEQTIVAPVLVDGALHRVRNEHLTSGRGGSNAGSECEARTEFVPAQALPFPESIYPREPVEVRIGGAIVFGEPVERFEKT